MSIGEAVALVEDADGGRVFLRGELVYAWSVGDVALRRLAAVRLVAIKAAWVADVAAAFKIDAGTLWRWGQQLSATGVVGFVPDKRGEFEGGPFSWLEWGDPRLTTRLRETFASASLSRLC